jgi:hypothetical protein
VPAVLTRLHSARARAGAPLALLITAVLAAALTGCGGSSGNGIASKSASDILAAAKAAAVSATSVHVAAKNSQGPLSLTLNLDLAGNGGRAQVSLAPLGLPFELIRIGSTLYLKGSPAFYKRLGAGAAKVPPGTWLKVPISNGQLAQLAVYTDLSGELNLLLSSTAPITKGATTTVNGQKAVELKQTAKLFAGSLYVATTGKPYPIQLVKRGRESGLITFSHWNAPVSLTAPPNAIALSRLGHEGH